MAPLVTVQVLIETLGQGFHIDGHIGGRFVLSADVSSVEADRPVLRVGDRGVVGRWFDVLVRQFHGNGSPELDEGSGVVY
ncbi:hypothetical protein D3C84_1047430 [compost metagenome]